MYKGEFIAVKKESELETSVRISCPFQKTLKDSGKTYCNYSGDCDYLINSKERYPQCNLNNY